MLKAITNPKYILIIGLAAAMAMILLINTTQADDGEFHVPSDWTCVQVSDTEAVCTAPPLVPLPTATTTATPELTGGTVVCYDDGNHMLVGSVDVVDWQGNVLDTVTDYESLVSYGWNGCNKIN